MNMIVDENGVIVGYIGEGDRIIRRASVDAVRDTETWHPEPHFVKLFPKAMRELSRLKCGGMELQVVFAMVSCLSFKSGLVMHANGMPVTADWVAKITGISVNRVYSTIRELARKNIIVRVLNNNTRLTEYYMNPYYFFKGDRINSTLVSMFADPKDRV